MSYFSDAYSAFRYPLQVGEEPGFRLAQLGAIHAVGAHFANRTEPGIVTMPTGSGKTAVLISAAFVLRATRVLIIAPSRLVPGTDRGGGAEPQDSQGCRCRT